MAHSNMHTCGVCGKQYEYCEHCSIIKPAYNADRFCSHEHQDIFAILSKHGCNLATAEETLEALKDYDVTNVTESIFAHIEKIKSEAGVKVEETVTIEEPIVAETAPIKESTFKYNKNNKKKW